MPLLATPRRKSDHSLCANLRMLIALLVAVALPAQAISASVERAWNATHYHLEYADRGDVTIVRGDAVATRQNADGHYPLQRARDMALSQQRMPATRASQAAQQSEVHHTHADAHRAGIAHHHDADVPDVVYVVDGSEQPTSAAERAGKHDHDGFSPAIPSLRALDAQFHDHAPVLIASIPQLSHVSTPGDRPPR